MSKRKKKIVTIALNGSVDDWDWYVRKGFGGVTIGAVAYWQTRKGAENHARRWFAEHFPDYELEFVE